MKLNPYTNQYELEEADLVAMGIQLRERLATRRAVNPDMIISTLLSRNSEMVYAYIHSFSVHNYQQDNVFLRYESARRILFRALRSQIVHILNVGDLTNSVKQEERENAVNIVTKRILEETIPELRVSIIDGRV